MGKPYYYIETDGMVYLVQRDDRWTLPHSPQEIPFEFEPRETMIIAGHEVFYCDPELPHHPREWHHKDEIPGLENVDPLVRLTVHHTLPRVVTEAIIHKGDQFLLVKPSRGFNAGQWTLPGGFVSYAESPAEALEREVKEEVGTPCRVGKLLGIESFVGKKSFYTWHMLFYEVELLSEEFRPAPDEIEEVCWFSQREARSLLEGAKRRIIERLSHAEGA